MYYQLGDIIFEGLVGFQTITQNEEENFVEQALIVDKPRLQHVGAKLDNIDATIRFHVSFCTPELEIEKLRTAKKAAQIMPLIMGDGRLVGDFVITKIGSEIEQVTVGGSLHSVKLTINLLEYFTPDKQASEQTQAVQDGFANEQNNPPLSTPTNVPTTPSMQAGATLTSGNANIMAGMNLSGTLNAASTTLKTTVQLMQSKVNKGLSDINKLVGIIDADASSELYAKTRDLSNSAGVLISKLGDVLGDLSQLLSDIDTNPGGIVASIAATADDVAGVLTQVQQVNAHASQMAAMIGLKK